MKKETIAPERLSRFTSKAGDFQELSADEVEQIMTPTQALAKHNAMMKQKYGDDDGSLDAPVQQETK